MKVLMNSKETADFYLIQFSETRLRELFKSLGSWENGEKGQGEVTEGQREKGTKRGSVVIFLDGFTSFTISLKSLNC